MPHRLLPAAGVPRPTLPGSACARRARSRPPRGTALLALLLLTLAGASLLLRQLRFADLNSEREKATHAALQAAREALIAYAATSAAPGRLPCPENTALIGTATEGSQRSSCSNALPAIGRLPWRSLKIEALTDGYGEPLWYALSPGFRSPPINTGSAGQLGIDAQPGGFAAIVLAAGPAQAGQSRPTVSAAAPPQRANYLDGTNGDGDLSFASNGPLLNDRLLGIAAAEIAARISRRVLAEIRGADTDQPPAYGLRRYYNEHSAFPFADSDGDGHADAGADAGSLPYRDLEPVIEATAYGWIAANQWFGLVGYRREAPDRVLLTLGSVRLAVRPCPAQPCPAQPTP